MFWIWGEICCPHKQLLCSTCVFQLSLDKDDGVTLWITHYLKKYPLCFARILLLLKILEVSVRLSVRRAVIEGRSLTRVSLSWAQRAQQIDAPPPPPPRLLPFSTDRLGAWALSQRYQSIRSYPQLPTLIGGQLPKGQEAWIIAQLWGAFFCLQIHMLWLKSLCSAINDSLSSDCHSSVTALWRSE